MKQQAPQLALPFNTMQPCVLLEPDPVELIKLSLKGWKIAHKRHTKTGISQKADSRLCLHGLIVTMAKSNWITVFSYYAELALHQNEGNKPLQKTVRRAFKMDGIEDKISEQVANMAMRF